MRNTDATMARINQYAVECTNIVQRLEAIDKDLANLPAKAQRAKKTVEEEGDRLADLKAQAIAAGHKDLDGRTSAPIHQRISAAKDEIGEADSQAEALHKERAALEAKLEGCTNRLRTELCEAAGATAKQLESEAMEAMAQHVAPRLIKARAIQIVTGLYSRYQDSNLAMTRHQFPAQVCDAIAIPPAPEFILAHKEATEASEPWVAAGRALELARGRVQWARDRDGAEAGQHATVGEVSACQARMV